MLYGVEVSEVSTSALKSLEHVHWDTGKGIQGLNRCTPNPSVIQSMDWLSITSIIDERRLGFVVGYCLLNLVVYIRKSA